MNRALLGLLLLVSGCRLAQDVVDLPAGAVRAVTPGQKTDFHDPVDLQARLLRFTDEFQTVGLLSMDQLRRGDAPVEPKTLLHWKSTLASATTSIASAANPRTGVLDMTVFVTLSRIAVEDHWKPKVFGESGNALLEACRRGEEEIWKLCALVLKPEQQKELRKDMIAWLKEHPEFENPLAARSVDFALEVAAVDKEASGKSDSVLNLLSLDPLSGLDPAVREIAQSRLFAERALFVAQRMPRLLRWQTELLGISLTELPAIQKLAASSTQIASAVDRMTAVAEKLPDRLAKERDELLKALENQEKTLKPMVHEVGVTLEAGTRMSESLNATLKTFEGVMKRLEREPGAAPRGEPFRIEDYTKAAMQIEKTAQQLTESIATLDRLLAADHVKTIARQVDPAVQRAEAGGKELLDRALRNAVILVGLVFGAALIYRVLAARIKPAKP